jgi:hypothetical protein
LISGEGDPDVSDFRDSYHLIGDVEALLQRAQRQGLIFPLEGRFTCFLVRQPEGGIDREIIRHNRDLLVHYYYAEDHGVWLDLFDGPTPTGAFAREWGPDFGGPKPANLLAPWKMVLDNPSQLQSAKSASEIVQVVGLSHVEHLTCDPANVKCPPWDVILRRARERFPGVREIQGRA